MYNFIFYCDLFYKHSNSSSNTNSLQTSLKPNVSIATQTRVRENATEFIKNIVKHEVL